MGTLEDAKKESGHVIEARWTNSEPEREQVRIENFDFIQQNSVRSLESNVVYAIAVKT